MKKNIRHIISILIWIAIWTVLWLLLPKQIHFAGPLEVAKRLVKDVQSKDFWLAIWTTYSGIVSGFFVALFLGTVFGYIAHYRERFRILMDPAMDFIRHIPMITFTLLAIVWGASTLLVFEVGLFLAIPVIYRHTCVALNHYTDPILTEVWKRDISLRKKLDYIYRPATMPEYIVGCHRAINMCCKSGILAQFIDGASHSVAKSLSEATDAFDITGIFSLTIVIVIISMLLEQFVIRLLSLTIVNETKIDVEKLIESINEEEDIDI